MEANKITHLLSEVFVIRKYRYLIIFFILFFLSYFILWQISKKQKVELNVTLSNPYINSSTTISSFIDPSTGKPTKSPGLINFPNTAKLLLQGNFILKLESPRGWIDVYNGEINFIEINSLLNILKKSDSTGISYPIGLPIHNAQINTYRLKNTRKNHERISVLEGVLLVNGSVENGFMLVGPAHSYDKIDKSTAISIAPEEENELKFEGRFDIDDLYRKPRIILEYSPKYRIIGNLDSNRQIILPSDDDYFSNKHRIFLDLQTPFKDRIEVTTKDIFGMQLYLKQGGLLRITGTNCKVYIDRPNGSLLIRRPLFDDNIELSFLSKVNIKLERITHLEIRHDYEEHYLISHIFLTGISKSIKMDEYEIGEISMFSIIKKITNNQIFLMVMNIILTFIIGKYLKRLYSKKQDKLEI